MTAAENRPGLQPGGWAIVARKARPIARVLHAAQGPGRLSYVSPDELILSVLDDIEPLMQAAFDAVGGIPTPGSSLDQVNLVDGRHVIVDYLAYNEAGLAFDHLLYMIVEPPLLISAETYDRLAQAGLALGLSPDVWKRAKAAS